MGERILVRKKKKKKRTRKLLLVIILLFLTLIGFGGYMAIQTLQAASDSYDDLGRDKSDLRDQAVSISKDPVSILLMGVEDYATEGDHGRTDTLMLATFSPNDERLKLLSIPRDTLVEIVGKGVEDKITHAHAFGGKEMTIDTVENFLDVPIDYYATVNFDAFKNVVDILGGITVNVPFDFQQNSDDRVAEKLQFYEGKMELDGRHALAYARMRKEDPKGDIGRNERQQEVIKSIIDKAMSVSTITKIDDLAKEIGKNVETNMKISEGLAFYKEYSDFSVSKMDKIQLETTPDRINGISYQIVDQQSLEEVKQTLKDHLEITN
ncbi:LCP family protein [Virgibacillus chiguensis]|uniref:Cell envelope-related function transcriptional attenuator common domain-containing protein n=1 Tax=Virgibacillus chiguensis TaxID=411959 RepID=A0A1M5UJC5_9BACI|nr:LCP family protein [Virgibacillus chiguensis]SHH63030.1 cell envelope-related function transcriptional attenuator common domain-containing protein [Virgibacillus chiguensis]